LVNQANLDKSFNLLEQIKLLVCLRITSWSFFDLSQIVLVRVVIAPSHWHVGASDYINQQLSLVNRVYSHRFSLLNSWFQFPLESKELKE